MMYCCINVRYIRPHIFSGPCITHQELTLLFLFAITNYLITHALSICKHFNFLKTLKLIY